MVIKKLFYGWWIVISCFIFYMYVGATYFYGFTALFNPMVDEFKWSYALVSLAFTLRGFEAGVLAPFVGFLVDRIGPKRLIAGGCLIFGSGFILLSYTNGLPVFYFASVILSLGSSFSSSVVSMAAVARWFKKHISVAMGLLTAGIAAGGFLVPAAVWSIDQYGWRAAVLFFGILALVLAIPLFFIIKDKPDNQTKSDNSLETTVELGGPTVKEALKTRNFWFLSLAILFSGISFMAIIAHQIPFITSSGISRQSAGLTAMVLATTNIAGRVIFGWLGDMFNKKYCFIAATVVLSASIFSFALSRELWHFIVSLLAIGLSFGGLVPLRPALQIELFGTRSFGTLQGLLMTAVTLGAVIAPLFAGWMYDVQGNYQTGFIILAGLTLLALPFICGLNKKVS